MAMDDDLRILVHAAAIEADMAADIDLQRRIEAAAMACWPLGLLNDPMLFIGVLGQAVKLRIDPPHANLVKIKLVHAWPPQV